MRHSIAELQGVRSFDQGDIVHSLVGFCTAVLRSIWIGTNVEFPSSSIVTFGKGVERRQELQIGIEKVVASAIESHPQFVSNRRRESVVFAQGDQMVRAVRTGCKTLSHWVRNRLVASLLYM